MLLVRRVGRGSGGVWGRGRGLDSPKRDDGHGPGSRPACSDPAVSPAPARTRLLLPLPPPVSSHHLCLHPPQPQPPGALDLHFVTEWAFFPSGPKHACMCVYVCVCVCVCMCACSAGCVGVVGAGPGGGRVLLQEVLDEEWGGEGGGRGPMGHTHMCAVKYPQSCRAG